MYFVIFCPQFNRICYEVNLHKKICAMLGMEMSSILEMHTAKSLNFMSTKSLQLEGSPFYRFASIYQRCTEISRFLSIFYQSKGINRTKYANTPILGNISKLV